MILFCGEALVDLLQVSEEGGLPVVRVLPGGSPANTAVALSRLGRPSALASRLGKDAWGDLVRSHLRSENVDTSLVVDADEPTTAAVVSLGGSRDARYHFYFTATAGASWREGDLPHEVPDHLEAFHLGSMAIAAGSGRAVIGRFVERVRDRAVVSIDPNVRLGVIPDLAAYRQSLEALVGRCHLVRVSSEDLELLYPGVDAGACARAWCGLGPRLVVVSLGAGGALACLGGSIQSVPARRVAVVDTMGAGDTFSAALLDSLARAGVLRDGLSGCSAEAVHEAIEFAADAAAVTCERTGADPPTAAEVAARRSRGGQ